jgi:hypothetical protein
MSFKNLVLAVLCASAVFLIGCNKTVPLINYENSPIVTVGGKADMDKIKKAIIVAGTRIGWQMQPVTDGHIVGSLFTRGHMAKVDIKYNQDTYSITYKDSSNLLYDGSEIHRQYNNWVDRLNRQIRAELSSI